MYFVFFEHPYILPKYNSAPLPVNGGIKSYTMKYDLNLILVNITNYLPIIIAIVLLVKIVLYIKFKTNNWTLSNLFYFSFNQIVTSKPKEKVNVKIVENSLSFYLLFLVVIDFFMVVVKNS